MFRHMIVIGALAIYLVLLWASLWKYSKTMTSHKLSWNILLKTFSFGGAIIIFFVLWSHFDCVQRGILAFFTVVEVVVMGLLQWKYKHPRTEITVLTVTSGVSALIFFYLSVIYFLYFLYLKKDGMASWKIIIKSTHVAFNAMTNGMLEPSDSNLAYELLHTLSEKGNTYFLLYIMTGIFLAVAPFNTAAWLLSFFDTKVGVYLLLFCRRLLQKNMLVFFDASDRSLLLAQLLYNKRDGKKRNQQRPVFCRCGSANRNISAENLSEIRKMKGLCLPETESDYAFYPKTTTYILCAQNAAAAYQYLSHFRMNAAKNIYVLANEMKNELKLIPQVQNMGCHVYSVWDTLAQMIAEKAGDSETFFLVGGGKIAEVILTRFEKDRKEIVVFPDNDLEYEYLLSNSNGHGNILCPSAEYSDSTPEDRLFTYCKNYRATDEAKRYLMLAADNFQVNIRRKRLFYSWMCGYFDKGKMSMGIYCNDVIISNNERNQDSSKKIEYVDYFGTEKELLNEILKEIKV